MDLLSTTSPAFSGTRFNSGKTKDGSHWEEVRKIAASSIGVATAGLEAWDGRFDSDWSQIAGRNALNAILPWECRQPDPLQQRRYDSALLFLIYPYQVVSPEMADQIVDDVSTDLRGEYGIRRYLGAIRTGARTTRKSSRPTCAPLTSATISRRATVCWNPVSKPSGACSIRSSRFITVCGISEHETTADRPSAEFII